MLKLLQELGMKDVDMRKTKFIDYLYTTAVETKHSNA
jgi:hypothetical protein